MRAFTLIEMLVAVALTASVAACAAAVMLRSARSPPPGLAREAEEHRVARSIDRDLAAAAYERQLAGGTELLGYFRGPEGGAERSLIVRYHTHRIGAQSWLLRSVREPNSLSTDGRQMDAVAAGVRSLRIGGRAPGGGHAGPNGWRPLPPHSRAELEWESTRPEAHDTAP